MIGNDVIDLAFAARESNWRRPRFLQKIFTRKEQDHIAAVENTDIAVWSLWSRKEAAYKIWNRRSNTAAFNPLKFECSTNDATETVEFFAEKAYTQTTISGSEIHTIAVHDQSDFERIVFINDCDLITKIDKLPYYNLTSGSVIPCSVSHHGQYYRAVLIS